MLADMLRDYQTDMLQRLERAWAGHRSVMVQMPTGTGKTVLMAEAVRNEELKIKNEKFILVVAHRRELIEQICRTLERNGIRDVTVTSIQKLAREAAPGSGAPSLVIIDEAHHALAKTYRMLWDWWPEAKFLGLTATPCRLNGAAFTDLFDVLLQSWPIQTFIDKGWLSDFEYVSAAPDSEEMKRVAALDKRGTDGDYQQKQMVTVMDVPESIEHLYETYRQFVCGKKGIVYAINREHAKHIAEYYAEQGVRCAVIDSRTPLGEREKLVERYRGGSTRGVRHLGDIASDITVVPDSSVPPIDVLVNVDIFGEGFDVPEVEFIQLARPTLSLSKYLQQVGRGMRVSEGKEAVTILDNVGLYQTFGLPTDERDWRLMFLGKLAGRANLKGDQQPMIIRDNEQERALVNLEMVRIKRRGERHEGLEVFVQGGKYGVMKDGVVTCRPEFEHINKISNGKYYAIATYPYAVFRNKSTVIGLTGMDLKASLYGKVTPHGELMEGLDSTGRRVYWDGVGGEYFKYMPDFVKVGGVQMVCKNGKFLPRQGAHFLEEPVDRKDIWYNNYILWMDKVVIVKGTGKAYAISAYGSYCFFVKGGAGYQDGLLKVKFDGYVSNMTYLDLKEETRMNAKPDWVTEQLTRASSGKLEYLNTRLERKRSQVIVY
ncbi:MAG: DEAD/DEAH box helicase [Bacteroidaceae bacterium]|nr:DEAD/DEAH box helicase [Bacteroidaceae bacterium]